ncbi:MAG: hypothetical protein FJ388_25625, partial [Verrucomicrobia bacterium]|nr:hypothetical protein [Verrucomicrobiota bacterium]
MRPEQELLKNLEAATGLKEKIGLAEQLLRVADQVADAKAVLEPVIHALSAQIKKSLHQQPATTLEAIWVRDELANLCGHQAHHTVGEIHEIVKNVRQLGELLESLPATKQKRLLPHVRTAYPETWHDTMRQLVMTADAKLAGDIIEFLVAEGQADAVQAFLDRVIREQTAPSELLLWVCRSRYQQAFAGMIGPLLNARLASAILHALQREQLQTTRRKNQLLDYLLNEGNLVADLLRAADLEEARDIARRILIHPAIGEMDRRSLMARIIKLHPPIQTLLTAGAEVRQQAVTVSWESLQQRKAEYDELVTKRIPANSKDIAVARSYGDLSENYEFKAAKETQRVLMARKAELETMLAIARGTDFADAKTD